MPLVSYAVEEGVARITLARPDSLNAVNRALNDELEEAARQASADEAVRVVLIDAEGRAFCAGADMKDPDTHNASSIVEYMAVADDGIEALGRCPKPIVAAVQGFAVGAGLEIALTADIVVAAEDAVFLQPQVGLGIVPGGGGLCRLVRQVGPAWASRMTLLCERVPAETAARIGLVSEVVSRDRLAERAAEVAAALAGFPSDAVRLAKEGLAEAHDVPLAVALRGDRYRLFSLIESEAKKASHAAFAADH